MTTETLSANTLETLSVYHGVVKNLIDAARVGGARLYHGVDQRWESGLEAASLLSDKLRSDLVVAEKEVTGYYVRGLNGVTDGAIKVVGKLAELTTGQIEKTAMKVQKVADALEIQSPKTLALLAMPVAQAAREIADKVAATSERVLARVAGDEPVAVAKQTGVVVSKRAAKSRRARAS